MESMLERLTRQAMEGCPVSVDEALGLEREVEDTDALCDAADRIRRARCGADIDTCAIVNARSGLCGEDCKWCSQAVSHGCKVEKYGFVDYDECLAKADVNHQAGVKRFSLVTSGRRVSLDDVRRFARYYAAIGSRCPGMGLCASMGLLDDNAMQALADAGVTRYHCNLETSAAFFPTLCTTHTRADKLAAIAAARRAGMEVCSGGIIGMGESLRDRLELVAECRDAGAVSIPVNLLNPIPGTPLQDTPLLDEATIVRTVALMRFVAPDAVMRFAGGRRRLSRSATLRILRGGMNGVMVDDLLTTAGNSRSDDAELLREASEEQTP